MVSGALLAHVVVAWAVWVTQALVTVAFIGTAVGIFSVIVRRVRTDVLELRTSDGPELDEAGRRLRASHPEAGEASVDIGEAAQRLHMWRTEVLVLVAKGKLVLDADRSGIERASFDAYLRAVESRPRLARIARRVWLVWKRLP
jgi:hypothetical protein